MKVRRHFTPCPDKNYSDSLFEMIWTYWMRHFYVCQRQVWHSRFNSPKGSLIRILGIYHGFQSANLTTFKIILFQYFHLKYKIVWNQKLCLSKATRYKNFMNTTKIVFLMKYLRKVDPEIKWLLEDRMSPSFPTFFVFGLGSWSFQSHKYWVILTCFQACHERYFEGLQR